MTIYSHITNWCITVTAKYLVSCEEARMLNPLPQFKDMMIDIDDSGPLAPFQAHCIFNRKSNCMQLGHE